MLVKLLCLLKNDNNANMKPIPRLMDIMAFTLLGICFIAMSLSFMFPLTKLILFLSALSVEFFVGLFAGDYSWGVRLFCLGVAFALLAILCDKGGGQINKFVKCSDWCRRHLLSRADNIVNLQFRFLLWLKKSQMRLIKAFLRIPPLSPVWHLEMPCYNVFQQDKPREALIFIFWVGSG